MLEDKIKLLEQAKSAESCTNALLALRGHLNRPLSLFDRFEAIELLETLVRLARTQAHEKADEYAAALEEVKARQPSLGADHLQRLMLGLVGDPLRAKMAKEAASILKGVSKGLQVSRQDVPRASLPRIRSSVTLVQDGDTLRVTASPDVEAVLDVGVDANDCVYNSIIQGFCMFCIKYFSSFVQTCLLCLGVGICPCPVDLGGTFSVSQFRT